MLSGNHVRLPWRLEYDNTLNMALRQFVVGRSSKGVVITTAIARNLPKARQGYIYVDGRMQL